MVLSNVKRVGVMKYSIPICSNCSEADIRDRIKSLSYHPTFIFTKKINRIWLRGIMGILRMRPVFPATLSVKQDGENKIISYSIHPGISFWVITFWFAVAFIYSVVSLIVNGITATSYYFIGGVILFEALNYFEYHWQAKRCGDMLEAQIKQSAW